MARLLPATKPRTTYLLRIEGGYPNERRDVYERIWGLIADADELWADHPRVSVLMDEISEQEVRDGIRD